MQAQSISMDAHCTIGKPRWSADPLTLMGSDRKEIKAYPRTNRTNLMISRLIENQGKAGDCDGHNKEADAKEDSQLKFPVAVPMNILARSFNFQLIFNAVRLS